MFSFISICFSFVFFFKFYFFWRVCLVWIDGLSCRLVLLFRVWSRAPELDCMSGPTVKKSRDVENAFLSPSLSFSPTGYILFSDNVVVSGTTATLLLVLPIVDFFLFSPFFSSQVGWNRLFDCSLAQSKIH